MKAFLTVAGCLVALVIALGFFLQFGESIPDRALVDVFPSRQIWIPHSKEASARLDALLNHPGTRSETLAMLGELTPATYANIRSGKYKRCRLAPGWGLYTDTFVTGYSTPVILYYVSTPASRWNQDASWNW